MWTVPDHWTLEEAASVPMAYVTAYYALVTRARLRKGETVFVQSGWTPVGQVRFGLKCGDVISKEIMKLTY